MARLTARAAMIVAAGVASAALLGAVPVAAPAASETGTGAALRAPASPAPPVEPDSRRPACMPGAAAREAGVESATATARPPATFATTGRSAPAPAGARPAATAIADAVIAAYGGRAALEKARVFHQRGRVIPSAHGGTEGHLERTFAAPDSLRIDIAYANGRGEHRVLHRGRGVRDGREVTGTPPHLAMVLQAARLALPLSLRGPGVRDAGPLEREGRTLSRLAIPLEGGLELVAEIDPGTHHVVRTVGTMPAPAGAPPGAFAFVSDYSDFRRVKGVVFAFREVSYAGGSRTGETVLEEIRILPAPPPAAFDLPAGR